MGSFALHSCVTHKLLFAGFDAIVWAFCAGDSVFQSQELGRLGGFDFAHGLLVAHDDNKTRFMIRVCNNRKWLKLELCWGLGGGGCVGRVRRAACRQPGSLHVSKQRSCDARGAHASPRRAHARRRVVACSSVCGVCGCSSVQLCDSHCLVC